jgi:hypothetical protein
VLLLLAGVLFDSSSWLLRHRMPHSGKLLHGNYDLQITLYITLRIDPCLQHCIAQLHRCGVSSSLMAVEPQRTSPLVTFAVGARHWHQTSQAVPQQHVHVCWPPVLHARTLECTGYGDLRLLLGLTSFLTTACLPFCPPPAGAAGAASCAELALPATHGHLRQDH